MFGSTDLKTRIEEQETYMAWKEDFETYLKYVEEDEEIRTTQEGWLYDWDPAIQNDPTGRVMVVLPLLLYELEQGVLPVEMEGELYGTKDDLEEGLLDELPEVELEEIKKDLKHCLELFESGKAKLLEK